MEGPASVTFAPSLFRRYMFERATRLKRMSPRIVTLRPLKSGPSFSRIVKASRSAWVGWACAPSPAFITGMSTLSARYFAAPDELWRTIIISAIRASMFLAVSLRVSPFTEDDMLDEKLITSAPSLCAAISNAVRVLVLGSKKRFTTVFPFRYGSFVLSFFTSALNMSARANISSISRKERSSVHVKSLRDHETLHKNSLAVMPI